MAAALVFSGCKGTESSGAKFAEVPGTPARSASAPAPVSTSPAAGTTNLSPTSNPTPVAAPPHGSTESGFDWIREGDSLLVTFSDLQPPVQPFEEHVNEGGKITLLHNQTFQAAGKNRGDLEREIHDRYVPDYYKFLTVTVKILNRFYFVDGEIKSANRYIYEGNITVLKAIASAGGFTDFANKKKVQVIRAGSKKIEVENCVDALDHPEKDLVIFPNDTVHVKRKWF